MVVGGGRRFHSLHMGLVWLWESAVGLIPWCFLCFLVLQQMSLEGSLDPGMIMTMKITGTSEDKDNTKT
ncbi:unnamed protein product [Lactuca virosa]|uniref:Uncharacterized protein n=1 Tax=Lactuca virosa TaxID=75947 RepID=A0AAU9NG39_9ASTR|nr:unnamed protein product [Lactuca virosa]